MSKKFNQLKVGSTLSYLQMALNIIIGLVYTPVMIKLLGQSEYGLYNTVSSTISMLSVLSLGFNSGYIRFYSRYKANCQELKIAKLNGLYLIIFAVIGIVGLLCGLYISFHLTMVFDKGLSIEEYKTAKKLMILLTLNLAISFPMSVFSNIISAHERFVFLKLLGIIRNVLSPLLTIPLLLMGYGSVAIVLMTVSINFVVDVCHVYYTVHVLGERFEFYGIEKGLFRELAIFTSFIAINMLIDQINWNIDKVLLGRFRGTISVAIYSAGYTLYHYYSMFSTAISGVFTPRTHKIVQKTQKNLAEQCVELTDLFTKVGRIQFIILGLISSGIVFFGKSFIFLWIGQSYSESYYVALLLILPASIALIQNLGIEIQRAENKHQFRSIAYSIMAVCNLVLSIYLCKLYGAVGSAIGTAISLVIANGIIMNIYYHKYCNINILHFWKSILSICKGLIVPIILGVILNQIKVEVSYKSLIIRILIYSIVYCLSMWHLGMNNYEKHLIYSVRKKLLH